MNLSDHPSKRIILILGPTAGGKTDLAVALAQRFDGEIISADSMQVYRQLNAGTAKPTTDQLQAVPHHMIDVIDADQPWTVADWLEQTEATLAELHRRGKWPIVVGGTNLYIKALLQGLFDGPPPDPQFRDSLDAIESPQLHERLRTVDPTAADRIEPNDRKRIIRALEVHHHTGQPISKLQQQWQRDAQRNPTYRYNPILLGLHYSPAVINPRINARVMRMFEPDDEREGLIEETQRLENAGMLGPTARKALGTKQVLEHLHGLRNREKTIEQVKIETRRFAKAQRTWLKRYRYVHWMDADQLSPSQWTAAAIQHVAEAGAASGH